MSASGFAEFLGDISIRRPVVNSVQPIAAYLAGMWQGARDGVLGPEFTNTTHKLLKIRGRLDFEKLQACCTATASRYPIVCATPIDGPDGVALQFGRAEDVVVDRISVEADAHGQANALLWRAYRWGRDPLLRVFCASSGDEHWVGLVLHHLAADNASIQILMNDLIAGYCSPASRAMASKPDVLCFADYADALERWSGSPAGLESKKYWQELLDTAPSDGAPLGKAVAAGAARREIAFFVVPETLNCLRESAKRVGVTLSTILLAIKFRTMFEVTGRRDIIIAVIEDRRCIPALSKMVGYLTDPTPVRIRISPDMSVGAIAGCLRHTWAENSRHAFSAYRMRSTSTARFGVMPVFNFIDQQLRGAGARLAALSRGCGLDISTEQTSPPAAPARALGLQSHYFSLINTPDGLRGSMRFSSAAIDEASGAAFIDRYCALLDHEAAA